MGFVSGRARALLRFCVVVDNEPAQRSERAAERPPRHRSAQPAQGIDPTLHTSRTTDIGLAFRTRISQSNLLHFSRRAAFFLYVLNISAFSSYVLNIYVFFSYVLNISVFPFYLLYDAQSN